MNKNNKKFYKLDGVIDSEIHNMEYELHPNKHHNTIF